MKALFIGGIKSGKSRLAEEFTLTLATQMPYYLATTEFIDTEMLQRIDAHKRQRSDNFITIEEPLALTSAIKKMPKESAVLIECMSIWINNMLYHKKTFADIQAQLQTLLALPHKLIFVLNDVGSGIIPDNALAREFIDISGSVSQILAAECDKVYHVIAGIQRELK